MKLSRNDSMVAERLEENAALNDKGELNGLEIIGASECLRDTIVESA